MSSVVEVVTAECQAIKVKQQLFQKTLDDDYDIILDQAKEIVEKRSVYGEEATRELLKSCEETMRLLVQAQAQHKAQFQALQVVPTRLSNSSSPADVEKAYASATAELISSEEEQSNNEKYKRLREIIDKAEGCSDAGPSQADDMGDDGFAIGGGRQRLDGNWDLLLVRDACHGALDKGLPAELPADGEILATSLAPYRPQFRRDQVYCLTHGATRSVRPLTP
jgi:rubrerythrin